MVFGHVLLELNDELLPSESIITAAFWTPD